MCVDGRAPVHGAEDGAVCVGKELFDLDGERIMTMMSDGGKVVDDCDCDDDEQREREREREMARQREE
eukprot:3482485-Rhodomonas_salina.2